MLKEFLNDYFILNSDFLIPLLISILGGFVVGAERELTNKWAGLRTHILVCVGSCIFTILSIFVLFLSYKVQAEDIIIEIVSTNAGEDCSTQMRFAWHSSISKCKFYITDANDISFAKAKVYDCEGVYDDVTFVTEKQTEKFYKFSFNLDDLTPGANYIYKISAENTYSDVYSFSTPDKSGYFNFIWSSDNHTNTETAPVRRIRKL